MPFNLPQRLAARVERELAEQGKTQNELANHLGVTQSTISRRLAGKYVFPLEELPRVALFLGVTVADLCGDDPRGQAADNSGQHTVSPTPDKPGRDGKQTRLDRPAASLKESA